MKTIAAVGLAALTLAACSRPTSTTTETSSSSAVAAPAAPVATTPAPAPAAAPAVSAAASSGSGMSGRASAAQTVRAFGAEPFWTLNVRGDGASYTDFSTENPQPMAVADVRTDAGAGRTTVRGRLPDGRRVTLTMTPQACNEAGEESSPMTASLQVGDRTLTGCAGPIPGEGFR